MGGSQIMETLECHSKPSGISKKYQENYLMYELQLTK